MWTPLFGQSKRRLRRRGLLGVVVVALLSIYVEIPVVLSLIQGSVNTFERSTLQILQRTEKKMLANERQLSKHDRSQQ